MATVKISSIVDETSWSNLRMLSAEMHRSISSVLTEAIDEYVQRRRVRAEVLDQLEASVKQNEKLGRLLAK